MSEVSAGSAHTSIDPLPAFESFESEGIPCELSSGEEEEVRWGGEGYLDTPLIPTLPGSIRCKGLAAEGVLRDECAFEEMRESSSREMLADARRTGDIIREPKGKSRSRMESLALRSSTEGLKGTLQERHVGMTRLTSATDYFSGWEEGGQCRRVFTAPPSGGHRQRRLTRAAMASDTALAGTGTFGGRGGVRVTADEGQVADEAGEDSSGVRKVGRGTSNGERNLDWGTSNGGGNLEWGTFNDRARTASAGTMLPSSLASARAATGRCRNTRSQPRTAPLRQLRHTGIGPRSGSRTGSRSGPRTEPVSSFSYFDAVPGSSVEGRPSSAAFPADWSTAQWSTAPSSLQASSSSMSARARARAGTDRPTATRRPGRNGGKLIIADPARSAETSRLAACLIQAAFLGVRDRLVVRRLREKRVLASTMIRKMWRRWRVRADKWEVARVERLKRLRKRVEDRKRDRAAHFITIFFRDISYQKQRVRTVLDKS